MINFLNNKKETEIHKLENPDIKDHSNQAKRAPEDIYLFFHSVHGYTSDGKGVHLGTEAFYHRADHTAYIINWGPRKKTVDSYVIPKEIMITKDEILEYLKENENVVIPQM